MGTIQTSMPNNEQTLSTLFPAMDAVTIQETLHTTKGDTGKAIVLLIQTPPSSPPSKIKIYEQHTDSNKKAFIKQKIKSNKCNRFYYILSILFWIFAAILFLVLTILSSTEYIVDSSFALTLCFCSIIELIFTLLILYGVILYKIWCIWVTLIWSGLHGITTIYSLLKWHNNSSFLLYYIAMVVIYWLSVFLFNIMYFTKLNAAETMFNSIIAETKDALIKAENKVPKNSHTPTQATTSTNNTEYDSNPSLNSEEVTDKSQSESSKPYL